MTSDGKHGDTHDKALINSSCNRQLFDAKTTISHDNRAGKTSENCNNNKKPAYSIGQTWRLGLWNRGVVRQVPSSTYIVPRKTNQTSILQAKKTKVYVPLIQHSPTHIRETLDLVFQAVLIWNRFSTPASNQHSRLSIDRENKQHAWNRCGVKRGWQK